MIRFAKHPLAIALLAVFHSAYAAEPLGLIEEVVISGSREGTAVRETPAAVNKITTPTLDQKKATF